MAEIETNLYDKEELLPNCTVQILTNTVTGEQSVGWWENPGWISVDDRLPDRFQIVITARIQSGQWVVEPGSRGLEDWWRVYGTRVKGVLYWQPLPEPPEEETS